MNHFEDIPNSTIEHLINEYIHSKRDREILKCRFIDGMTHESIAEQFELSPNQIKNIVYKKGDKILKRIS